MLYKKPRVGDILIYKALYADGTESDTRSREMKVVEIDGNILHYIWLDTMEPNIIIWKHRKGMNPFLTRKD